MRLRSTSILLTLFLGVTTLRGQENLLQKASTAFEAAQEKETELNEKTPADRTRSDYVKVINAFQKVYLITPRTGYADNSLITMARLYEEMQDPQNAIKTLRFLIKEYPQTPFFKNAERDIERLSGTGEVKMATVDGLRYWEAQNSVRVVVDVNAQVTFKQGEVDSPYRAFVDISPARLNSALVGKEWPVGSGLLQKVRAGQFDANTVRVVLDVGTMRKVTSFTLHDPDRLIIDVVGDEESAPVTPSAPSIPSVPAAPPVISAAPPPAADSEVAARIPSPPAVTPVPPPSPAPPVAAPVTTVVATPPPAPAKSVASTPVAAAPAPPKPVASAAPATAPVARTTPADEPRVASPAQPTNRGSYSLTRSLGLKISRVVIDAGHGGHDTGSIGPTGFTEKELVLDVATRLKAMVENELGAEVVMTRSDDTFVPLEARTAIANQEEADLFISIHANSSKTKTVRGVETFFLNLPNTRDALETASRENAFAEGKIHQLQDITKRIMLSDKLDESREFAQHVQKAMAHRKDSGPDRGMKQAPFVVLIGANMPSILAEISFISNPQEEKLLKTPKYRQDIADSLLNGIRSYADTLGGLKTATTQGR